MAAVADAAVFSYKAFSQDIEQACEATRDGNTPSDFPAQEPCACSKEDIIIFAEFSEVSGPVPLLTIPSKLESYEDLDINDIILRIMTVDYQANSSGQFGFSQDVEVLQADVVPGRHAYVHYCTLNDLRARGFVRPLCFAYVSADYMKLQKQFDNIRCHFLLATDILKYNNRQKFIDEIFQVLNYLKMAQNRYFFCKKKEEDGEPLLPEEQQALAKTHVDQLAHQHTELRHMLLTTEVLQNDDDLAAQIRKWQQNLLSSKDDTCHHYVFCAQSQVLSEAAVAASLGSSISREPLRTIPALSPWGLAALLWELFNLRNSCRECRLHVPLCMFPLKNDTVPATIEAAVNCEEFLQLLYGISKPYEWSTNEELKSGDIPSGAHDSLEYIEANLVASGNEASSSYHSVPESLSELAALAGQLGCSDGEDETSRRSGSLESFLDVASDSDSWDETAQDEEEYPLLWSSCAWSTEMPSVQNMSGRRILHFFQRYPRAAQHLVYSLLTGRTVVLAGSEQHRLRIRGLLVALTALVPVTEKKSLQVL